MGQYPKWQAFMTLSQIATCLRLVQISLLRSTLPVSNLIVLMFYLENLQVQMDTVTY